MPPIGAAWRTDRVQGVAKRILLSEIEQAASPLTIEELETGLRSGGAIGD